MCGQVSSADAAVLKQIIGDESEEVTLDGRPTLAVDTELLKKACNIKERSAKDSLFRLKQLSALARLVGRGRISKAVKAIPPANAAGRPFAQWSTDHDQELLMAINQHGVDEAPAAVLAEGTVSKLAAAHLAAAATSGETAPTSPSGAAGGDARTLAEVELKKRLAARITECLKKVPEPHSGGGGGEASAPGRLGGGGKRLGKTLASGKAEKSKKRHRGGGSGDESDGDFRKKKSKHADSSNGKPASASEFRPIKVDATLTLVHPGTHLPPETAFRPRDSAGASGKRLVYPPGYVSTVLWKGRLWQSEIRISENRPSFRVLLADGQGKHFTSSVSPSDVWRQVGSTGARRLGLPTKPWRRRSLCVLRKHFQSAAR